MLRRQECPAVVCAPRVDISVLGHTVAFSAVIARGPEIQMGWARHQAGTCRSRKTPRWPNAVPAGEACGSWAGWRLGSHDTAISKVIATYLWQLSLQSHVQTPLFPLCVKSRGSIPVCCCSELQDELKEESSGVRLLNRCGLGVPFTRPLGNLLVSHSRSSPCSTKTPCPPCHLGRGSPRITECRRRSLWDRRPVNLEVEPQVGVGG